MIKRLIKRMTGYCNKEAIRINVLEGKSVEQFRDDCQNEVWTRGDYLDRGVSGAVYVTCLSKEVNPSTDLNRCDYVVKEQRDDRTFRKEVLTLLKLAQRNVTRPDSTIPISPCIFDHWICNTPKMSIGFAVLQRLKGGNMKGKQIFYEQQQQLSRLLDVLHTNNIVFLDLNPGNVLLDSEGLLYLSDFGYSEDFDVMRGLPRQIFGINSHLASFEDGVREDIHKLETIFQPTQEIHWRQACYNAVTNIKPYVRFQTSKGPAGTVTIQRVSNLIHYYSSSRIAEKLRATNASAVLVDDFICDGVGYLVYKEIFKYPYQTIQINDIPAMSRILDKMHEQGIVMGRVKANSFGEVDTLVGTEVKTEIKALDFEFAVDYGSFAKKDVPLEVQISQKVYGYLTFEQAVQNDFIQLNSYYSMRTKSTKGKATPRVIIDDY